MSGLLHQGEGRGVCPPPPPWGPEYLRGWRDGARAVADPQSRPAGDWRLTFGIAIEPYRLGYRAALAAAAGR